MSSGCRAHYPLQTINITEHHRDKRYLFLKLKERKQSGTLESEIGSQAGPSEGANVSYVRKV